MTVVDLEEIQVSATLESYPGEGKEATLLMEVEVGADGELDPYCCTSEMTSLTRDFDPDHKFSEEGTVTQDLDPGGGWTSYGSTGP